MLFVEARFFLFIALVFAFYWSLRVNFHRKVLLLGASYFFYGCWDWRFAIMLFAISLADYFFARAMADCKIIGRKKLLVTLSVVMNMGVLCYFKYFNFFADSFVGLCNAMGFHASHVTINVILPVGVSFFTFQALSYTIDVYRGTIKPARLVVDYLLSSSFFPQLVAGPIVRPAFFLPQLARRREFPLEEVRPLLALFFLGFLKKACLADNISPYVDRIFADPHA
ncbi:MAG: MBOAT family protein, partial [Sphingobacteriales bacterium]